jgi:TRAP-type mannitol/chloroaromatic compound transport system permease small subunit|tara:strand:+ start:1982 stop:2863 length:882 start_codon:yes stop_codon:yes gene_type:complete
LDWFIWFLQSLVLAFYNFGYVVTHPMQWLDWSNGKSVMRFIYYGASAELFFVCLAGFLLLTCVGMLRNSILWVVVRSLEWIANTVGRMAAWAGLLMVLQQIVIVFVQRIFLEAQITFGLGVGLDKDISWYAEELKFYNAIIVCLCAAYTFVQGGHVRVDLVYAAVSYRTKKLIDMFGSLFFMIPAAVLTWMYAWFFLWRHLITPKVSASDSLQRLVDGKSRAFKWNVETIGFSPNGFNAYFLFKVLLVVFCAMIILQAVAFFYRSYLEMKEGQASEGKYLDKDVLGDEQALVV